MEKDLSRIVAKAGIEVPEASETENADTMAGQPEDTDINVADFSGYETVQKEFEKLCALEVRKLEEFLKCTMEHLCIGDSLRKSKYRIFAAEVV